MFLAQLYQLACLLDVSNGDDEQLGFPSTGRFEQVQAGDITIVDLEPELAQHVNVGGIVVENYGSDPGRDQQPAQIGPEPSETGQNNLVTRAVDGIVLFFLLRC